MPEMTLKEFLEETFDETSRAEIERELKRAKSEAELLELLSAVAHRQWAHWTRYMLQVLAPNLEYAHGNDNDPEYWEDPDIQKANEAIRRWKKQIATDYVDLTDEEKASDREWGALYLNVIDDFRMDPPGPPVKVGDRMQVKHEAWKAYWMRFGKEGLPLLPPQLVVAVDPVKGVKLTAPALWWPRDEVEHVQEKVKEQKKTFADIEAELRKQAGLEEK